MRLLIDFLCRFGWGLSLALAVTPAALVPSGFFRVNLLVVLGLATFASLLERTAVPGAAWMLPAAAAVVAWLGSVAWLAERKAAGIAACGVCAVLMAAATVTAQPRPTPLPLLSGLVVGLTVHAMLLGHWYLNAPGMRVDALRRMIDVALVAWLPQLVIATLEAGSVRLLGDASAGPAVVASATTSSLLALRWLAGLVGLPVLLWMSRKTLDIPNTQSATGILYVACLAAIIGELAAQLLAASG